jgi:DNA-binding transcriptional MerR regulator
MSSDGAKSPATEGVTAPARGGDRLPIGAFARWVGAAPSALRYWERAGLLSPEREGGRRRYGPDAAQRVGLIRLCQDAGFGIGEIRDLLAADPVGGGPWRDRAEAKLAEVRAEVARLQEVAATLEHVLACPAPTLGTCPTFAGVVRWRAEGGEPPQAVATRAAVPGGDAGA